MRRILMIAYTTYIHDGRVKRHAEALAERGDQIDVICLDHEDSGPHNGVNVIGLRIPRYRGQSRLSYIRSYVGFFTQATVCAARLSFKQRYDLVIVCTMPDAAVLCAVLPRLLGSKVMLDVHDTMPELYKDKFGGRRGALGARLLMLEERASAWAANRVLAVHEPHRERLAQAGIQPNKIKVVMNVPDPRIFKARSNHLNGHSGPFTIVCHGTVAQRLGLDVAIHAIDLVREKIPHVLLRIIGAGDYWDRATELARSLNLSQWITFDRLVPLEQLPAELAGAQIGLVPNHASSATHLMLPVKLMEYATLGIPVIASRLKTIEHYFPDDAVRYFAPGNSDDLAAAIIDLYLHPEQRLALANRASEVIAGLCWKTQREHYYQAIDSLLA